ncbi:MAG: hypothetical protein OJF49_003913 [Ktedonobacterales bacterium]|jgi:DMSO reductase anchor subunit|nr:MAG: hypothetical protein OJF49_003913 [Ktedonobacterales bacterium]
MQVLPLALFLVMLELTVGSFLSLYLLDLRGDTSRGFVIFQGALYLVFAVLTLLAFANFASLGSPADYGLDPTWYRAQGPLLVATTLLMIPWNILLWADRQPRDKAARKAAAQQPTSALRRARFAVGALTTLAALVAIFAAGMAYRTLAASRLDGAFVVLAFVAGAVALGGVMTAMLLGHWYLNTPTASGKPLEFVTALLVVALFAELVFSLFIGPTTARAHLPTSNVTPGTTIQTNPNGITIITPTPNPTPGAAQDVTKQEARQAPVGQDAMRWLEYLMGFLAPLALGGIALYLTRGRSFQSATGMLYLCVAFIFIGEVIGRGLLLFPVLS